MRHRILCSKIKNCLHCFPIPSPGQVPFNSFVLLLTSSLLWFQLSGFHTSDEQRGQYLACLSAYTQTPDNTLLLIFRKTFLLSDPETRQVLLFKGNPRWSWCNKWISDVLFYPKHGILDFLYCCKKGLKTALYKRKRNLFPWFWRLQILQQ